jgi:hypothetical protein
MVAVEDSRTGVWHEFKNYGRGRTKALMLRLTPLSRGGRRFP